jgi:hypothetical protein
MNATFIFIFFLLLMIQDENPLKKYHWKNRVVLNLATSGTISEFVKQDEILKRDTAGIKDRDIVILQDIKDDTSHSHELYDKYADPGENFTFVLIGKDGGVKWKTNSPASLDELFRRIDSMPMRQSEIREKGH